MSIKIKDQPFYIQSTAVLFGIILLIYVMSQLADILVPLAFAAFLAILLNPLCNWLQQHKFGRGLSIVTAMLIALIVITALFYFLSTQIMQFGDALPTLEKKFSAITLHLKEWISQNFNVSVTKQDEMVSETLHNSRAMVGKTLNGLIGTLGVIVLLPVYIFFMLLYKTLILNFLYEFSPKKTQKKWAKF
jgi:predicted PurR-regulated permease PerM